jgi:hypothetical protein
VNTQLEALVTSMLFEGYALYPYTPQAAKNATPTPFGIVYPSSYAAQAANTHDQLQLDVAIEAPAEATLSAQVRFLEPGGERHQAVPRRVELDGPGVEEFEFGRVRGRVTLARDGDRVRLRVENLTAFHEPEADRPTALRSSLLSTHAVIETGAGRFLSPLDHPGANVNCWPVLATDADDAVLAAAIVLPDHPQLAPDSKGDLFDGTEIEEALLLHVQVLSDGERAEIAAGDPAVAAMIERAAKTTPEELMTLHGRVEVRDRETNAPPVPSAAVRDPTRGETEVTVDGRTFRRGDSVVLRPSPEADLQARMLDGRSATIERIFVDYDGKVHLGVIADGLPGQDLLRETSRFLFFFPPEVEVAK